MYKRQKLDGSSIVHLVSALADLMQQGHQVVLVKMCIRDSYNAFERYPARADIAEKVVPDTDPAKEMYSRYASECNVCLLYTS